MAVWSRSPAGRRRMLWCWLRQRLGEVRVARVGAVQDVPDALLDDVAAPQARPLSHKEFLWAAIAARRLPPL